MGGEDYREQFQKKQHTELGFHPNEACSCLSWAAPGFLPSVPFRAISLSCNWNVLLLSCQVERAMQEAQQQGRHGKH